MQLSRTVSRPMLTRSGLRVSAVAKPKSVRNVARSNAPEKRLNATAVPLFSLAAADAIRELLTPPAEYFNTLDLPEALIHWGHPGNMAVVLFAMGGYGALYQGWMIRTSDDADVVAAAKDSHPKLAMGMLVFFALGAVGGMMSLVMQGKPILESPHVVSGLAGLGLLGVQATLPVLFASQGESARTAHAFLGTGILVHAGLGLQLGLSL